MVIHRKILAALIMVMLGLGLALVVMTTRPSAAQDNKAAETLREFLTGAQDSKTVITIEFAIPLITGERVWTLPDAKAKREMSVIGADYICFSEPWNNGARQRCTPYSNIVSFTYLSGQ
jgi:hypothetical protein